MQPGSVEAARVCEELMKLAEGMKEEKDSWTYFTIVTKARPFLMPFLMPLLIGVLLLYAVPWWRHSTNDACLSFSSNRIE